MSDKQKFAFDKVNFILLAIGMAIVIIGFLLMTGPTSSETVFEPDIFSAFTDIHCQKRVKHFPRGHGLAVHQYGPSLIIRNAGIHNAGRLSGDAA